MVAGQACKEDLEGILRGEKLRPSLRREKYGRTSDGPKKVILVVGMNKAAPGFGLGHGESKALRRAYQQHTSRTQEPLCGDRTLLRLQNTAAYLQHVGDH